MPPALREFGERAREASARVCRRLMLAGVPLLSACARGPEAPAGALQSVPAPARDEPGVYATFDPPREIAIGRSGGYTRLPRVARLEGTLIELRGDTLVVLVARLEGEDARAVGVPLGATARLVPDGGVKVTRGGAPVDHSTSRRVMRGLLIGLLAAALALALLVAGWDDPS